MTLTTFPELTETFQLKRQLRHREHSTAHGLGARENEDCTHQRGSRVLQTPASADTALTLKTDTTLQRSRRQHLGVGDWNTEAGEIKKGRRKKEKEKEMTRIPLGRKQSLNMKCGLRFILTAHNYN